MHKDCESIANIKVKGIRLSSNTIDLINFKQILEMAKSYIDRETKTYHIPQKLFKITNNHEIETVYLDKLYRATSIKRKIVGNKTLPYGF